MANENFSRQQNSHPEDEVSHRIVEENNFSGTVIAALQNVSMSGPDAPDLIWGGRSPYFRDAVDGPHGGIAYLAMQGRNQPVARPRHFQGSVSRDSSYGNPEVTTPAQSKC